MVHPLFFVVKQALNAEAALKFAFASNLPYFCIRYAMAFALYKKGIV